ncbi:condensation domain-containing protein [Saccharopolyspora flava]|uniref:Condensation domain-containing protein n=1 Tax=Saccharopolyspora flava TaxID=95161 RepID=A0A1I6QK34_9PSEU|nr:condensation domain-containing protein [Saccharopolyspora flava]SFS52648.1 Condensation domain-containing protein [Saccharopolyspora flava]
MHVTAADLWHLAPGDVRAWTVTPTGTPEPAALSVNQRNHLASAAAGNPAVWLAATFEVEGPINDQALTQAFKALVSRHDSLHHEFHPDTTTAVRHNPTHLTVHPLPPSPDLPGANTAIFDRSKTAVFDRSNTAVFDPTNTAGFDRARVRELLDRECAPGSFPAFVLVAVSRPGSSTVVCGFDHAHVDAHSIALIARDLHALYTGDELPAAGSFAARVAEWSQPSEESGPAMASWREFLDAVDYRLPVSPVKTGVPEGKTAEQATDRRLLADSRTTAALSEVARAKGTTTFGALLSTMASAVGEVLPVLVPVQTRGPEDADSVGWFTTTVPVWADPDLTRMGEHLARGRERAEPPLDQVLSSLPRPLRADRRDVFMVSYIDYRRLPETPSAQHVSGTAPADDVQLWLARTADGVHARTRFPDTPDAHRAVTSLLQTWSTEIRKAAQQ